MNRENKEEYREFLEDMTCEYCEPKRYCILKEFLISLHPSPRLISQIKMVDKFKIEKSKELKYDVGWDLALHWWVEQGYAKKFGDVWDEDIKFNVLYKKIRNGNK